MKPVRHIIVCEGESEWVYLQRLQSFINSLPTPDGTYEVPLQFIPPARAIAKSGKFSSVIKNYRARFRENKNSSIQVWVDFDLYHRNDNKNADLYKLKQTQHPNTPDFHFSFHNFEDFLALHFDDAHFNEWKRIFHANGHFNTPLHETDYMPAFKTMLPAYRKGDLPAGFVSKDSLARLKKNTASQPRSNPENLRNIKNFADFLINQIETAFPTLLA